MSITCLICSKDIGTFFSWKYACDVCSKYVCSDHHVKNCCYWCYQAIEGIIGVMKGSTKDQRFDSAENLGIFVGDKHDNIQEALFALKKKAYAVKPDAIVNIVIHEGTTSSLKFESLEDMKHGKAKFDKIASYQFSGEAVKFIVKKQNGISAENNDKVTKKGFFGRLADAFRG